LHYSSLLQYSFLIYYGHYSSWKFLIFKCNCLLPFKRKNYYDWNHSGKNNYMIFIDGWKSTTCDQVCKKGSYSLSELLSLIHHNSSCFQPITFILNPAIVSCKEDKWTKYQGDNIFTSQVTGCQVHAIKKAIRPLIADRVTYNLSKKKVTGAWNRCIHTN